MKENSTYKILQQWQQQQQQQEEYTFAGTSAGHYGDILTFCYFYGVKMISIYNIFAGQY